MSQLSLRRLHPDRFYYGRAPRYCITEICEAPRCPGTIEKNGKKVETVPGKETEAMGGHAEF
tara:strand:+ start:153 stop:338 length:186 start_codon:yes stop_codon:yes gene_type:complete